MCETKKKKKKKKKNVRAILHGTQGLLWHKNGILDQDIFLLFSFSVWHWNPLKKQNIITQTSKPRTDSKLYDPVGQNEK